MRFALSDEQRGFSEVLDDLLAAADTPHIVRRWAEGDHDQGLKLWQHLAEVGLTGLLVAEERGGLGGSPVDLVVAFEALGRHAVPGPWVESAALLPVLLQTAAQHTLVEGVASGQTIATVAIPRLTPYALDADVATEWFVLDDAALYAGVPGGLIRSVDPARRLSPLGRGPALLEVEDLAAATAVDTAVLACTAQLLGAGERLIEEAVEYAKVRRQFGRAIGEFQSLKHALADVRVALDFARPLVYVAALSLGGGSPDAARDVSAAKVAVGDAAYAAARTALQVHGAIGYTAEHDLGLWITKVRALLTAWGTPTWHRERVLAAISRPEGG